MARSDPVNEDERLPASGGDPPPARFLPGPRLARTLIAAVAVLAVVGVAVVAFRIWGGGSDQPPVIAAPAGPIKVRPTDPGGARIPNLDKEIFERLDGGASPPAERLLPQPEEPVRNRDETGDAPAPETAGAAGEAPSPEPSAAAPSPRPEQPVRSRIGTDAPPAPATAASAVADTPSPEPGARPPAAVPEPRPAASRETPKKTASRPPPAGVARTGGTFMIQLSSLRSEGAVRRAWSDLQRRHRDLLGGLSLNIQRAVPAGRKQAFYRMRAGPLSTQEAAKDLCSRLKARRLDCLVVRR